MLCSSYRLFKQASFGAILCTLLATHALATPLALEQRSIFDEVSVAYAAYKNTGGVKRDSVSPPITKPDANSVWPIGTVQEVTWDTSGLPPDNQITNIIGRVILGRDSGDSLNLDLDHPLAQGFHIRQGRVNITVPNVPPRKDYLIVLMGNSGNTSPSFAITRIADGNNNSSPSPSTSGPIIDPEPSLPGIAPTRITEPPILSSTTITNPIPISGTTITGSWGTSILSYPTSGSPTVIEPSASSAPAVSPSSDAAEGPQPSNANQQNGNNGVQTRLNSGLLLGCVFGGLLLGF